MVNSTYFLFNIIQMMTMSTGFRMSNPQRIDILAHSKHSQIRMIFSWQNTRTCISFSGWQLTNVDIYFCK